MPRTIDVKMTDIVKDVTVDVRVTGLRWYMLRARVGVALVRLGIWAAGLSIDKKHGGVTS